MQVMNRGIDPLLWLQRPAPAEQRREKGVCEADQNMNERVFKRFYHKVFLGTFQTGSHRDYFIKSPQSYGSARQREKEKKKKRKEKRQQNSELFLFTFLVYPDLGCVWQFSVSSLCLNKRLLTFFANCYRSRWSTAAYYPKFELSLSLCLNSLRSN